MWVVNAEGVYIENRPYHSYLEDDILTAINEKYGTNFSSLTYLREPTIAIGDDCPNWNAYEKIEGGGETLCAIEFEAGKFAFGHADEDEIFLATENGFAKIWYADENGVITGHTEHGAMVWQIINAYNEHFGTNIENWAPEKVTLQVGDTVSNWNAYEKITMR